MNSRIAASPVLCPDTGCGMVEPADIREMGRCGFGEVRGDCGRSLGDIGFFTGLPFDKPKGVPRKRGGDGLDKGAVPRFERAVREEPDAPIFLDPDVLHKVRCSKDKGLEPGVGETGGQTGPCSHQKTGFQYPHGIGRSPMPIPAGQAHSSGSYYRRMPP